MPDLTLGAALRPHLNIGGGSFSGIKDIIANYAKSSLIKVIGRHKTFMCFPTLHMYNVLDLTSDIENYESFIETSRPENKVVEGVARRFRFNDPAIVHVDQWNCVYDVVPDDLTWQFPDWTDLNILCPLEFTLNDPIMLYAPRMKVLPIPRGEATLVKFYE
jgi:hypothetical protein